MGLWQEYKQADRKKKALYILALIILILLLIGLFWWVYQSFQTDEEQPTINQPVTNEPVSTPGEAFQDTINPVQLEQERAMEQIVINVRIVAEPFVERFGSYNNQDSFQNFEDIEVFMTPTLRNWVQNSYIPQLRQDLPPPGEYYAINTRVLASEVLSLDETAGTATLQMTTQRQEIGSLGTQSAVLYQEVEVSAVREDRSWKIAGVFWQ